MNFIENKKYTEDQNLLFVQNGRKCLQRSNANGCLVDPSDQLRRK